MLNQRAKQTLYLRSLVDAAMLGAAFLSAFAVRSYIPLPLLEAPEQLSFAVHFWLPAIALPLFWALSRNSRLHSESSLAAELKQIVAPVVYLGLLLGTTIFLFQAKSFSRAVFFLFLALAFVFVALGRLALRAAVARLGGKRETLRNVLIVGADAEAHAVRRHVEAHSEYRVRVVGHLRTPGDATRRTAADAPEDGEAVIGSIDELKSIVDDHVVDEVIFVVQPAEIVACETQIAWCEEVGVTVHLRVDFIRTLVARTYPTDLDGMPMLTFSSTPQDPAGLLIKRALDIAVSAVALLLLSPLLALTALAVRLGSSGPVIFSQLRVGLNGRPFRLHKFRSMYRDAEGRRAGLAAQNEASGPVFKIARDPRVTPLGRWLRKFSIDELPQLWNVLVGDMSLVGPRPPLHDEVVRYQRWQKRKLSMKPGITCLWQVNGRSAIPFEDWMRLDLEYIDNWSLGLDLKILLRTIPAVVLARGAR